MKRHGRRQPYTEIGITRLPCFRCGQKPGAYQWQVCADGNLYRVVCKSCDVGLNELALRYMNDPDAEAKIARYRAKVSN